MASSASSTSVSSVVLSRYAGVLVDLAEDAGLVEKVSKDFRDMGSMIEASSELQHVVFSPLINRKKQEKLIDDIAASAKFQTLTKNFLGVLVQNRRLNALLGIIKAYEREIATRSGEVLVQLETASELTKTQEKQFRERLSKALGSDVSIQTSVVPEILGGVVVTIGSYMVDDSVRRKLERLGTALRQGSNQNTVQNLKEVV